MATANGPGTLLSNRLAPSKGGGGREVEKDWEEGRGEIGGVVRKVIHSFLPLLTLQKQGSRRVGERKGWGGGGGEKNVPGNISPMQVSLGEP